MATAVCSAAGAYGALLPLEPGLYGGAPAGVAGALPRLFDTFSYFTIWSNVVVAVSLTLLARDPGRDTVVRRALRLDGLMMILVTMLVYQLVLAPDVDVQGWSLLTDPWLHLVTPVVTLVVWLVWGPRGWVTVRLLPAALVVPLLWITWMLARGAVTETYPYGFVNVVQLGYAAVLRNVVAVLAVGLVIATVLWGVDVLRGRAGRRHEAA
ncbi:MAG: hypothetical protein CMH83_16695 [Nocardioides sp.]|nr:hypothetical protein [Nocardioides sp.]